MIENENKNFFKNNQTITVQKIKSSLRRNYRQEFYLRSLGLRKLNQIKILPNNNMVIGLLKKVNHLIKIINPLR